MKKIIIVIIFITTADVDYFNSLSQAKGLGENLIKPIRILEIGVYAGLSLIELVRRIPNSIGVGIDQWKNYDEYIISDNDIKINNLVENIEEFGVEKIFYENVEKSGLKDRIKALKGNSTDVLLDLIRKDERFDFIYVDGSHLCLDAYSDLILAWQILNSGGILAIDDYLFNKNSQLESPFEAVDHFLEKYKDNYKILSKEYRVFIEKIN